MTLCSMWEETIQQLTESIEGLTILPSGLAPFNEKLCFSLKSLAGTWYL